MQDGPDTRAEVLNGKSFGKTAGISKQIIDSSGCRGAWRSFRVVEFPLHATPNRLPPPRSADTVKAIRFDRPLPLLVNLEADVYDLRTEFDTASYEWRVAAFRCGNDFAEWITKGRSSRPQLLAAVASGIEIVPAVQTAIIISLLMEQGRAQSVETANP